ncbi:MAG TPA: FtsQ-type POTRA domain-containing protein [Terriglobia bacterium]|nr:FtsQ-type POTRA domain-containing protein [Terriglobia bacterium]
MKPHAETSLPGDFDSDAEVLYRRRQKNIDVRRSHFPIRARRIVRWLLLGGLAMMTVGYGGIRLAAYASHSPRFHVTGSDDVVIDGNQYVSREEILSATGLPLYWTAGQGVSIFRMNLNEARRQVESISWVKSAVVTRAFPHRLAVHIVERVPVAFVTLGGQVKLVDVDGVYLEKPDKAGFNFPVLEGLDTTGNAMERVSRIAMYLDFIRQLGGSAPSSGWLISEVNLADADDLKAMLVQGRESVEVHFGRSNFQERFSNFLALLPDIRKTNAKIDSVDLRYRNQVVVNPEGNSEEGQQKTEK